MERNKAARLRSITDMIEMYIHPDYAKELREIADTVEEPVTDEEIEAEWQSLLLGVPQVQYRSRAEFDRARANHAVSYRSGAARKGR